MINALSTIKQHNYAGRFLHPGKRDSMPQNLAFTAVQIVTLQVVNIFRNSLFFKDEERLDYDQVVVCSNML